jgi:hypothetical protein
MRHRNPSGDLAAVVERALDALLEKLEKERLGRTARPRVSVVRRSLAMSRAPRAGRSSSATDPSPHITPQIPLNAA